jgi:hypothetical protein
VARDSRSRLAMDNPPGGCWRSCASSLFVSVGQLRFSLQIYHSTFVALRERSLRHQRRQRHGGRFRSSQNLVSLLCQTLVGATLGLLFALAVDLGLIGLGGELGSDKKRSMRLVVMAGLGGLFAENVLKKLQSFLIKQNRTRVRSATPCCKGMADYVASSLQLLPLETTAACYMGIIRT